jgi:hypothetical protein
MADYGSQNTARYLMAKFMALKEIKPQIDLLALVVFYQGPKCKLEEVKRNFKKFIKSIYDFLWFKILIFI